MLLFVPLAEEAIAAKTASEASVVLVVAHSFNK
jgi:hypothetical protein